MFCAYCGEDHGGSAAFSDEHAVPYAIGGANAFTIRVCQTSNNRLGGLVDKPFVEMFAVRSKRFFLGLCGRDGTEPTLDLCGRAEINGKEVDVTCLIRQDESKQLKITSPSVTKTHVAGGEHWAVFGDPAIVRRILEGKLKTPGSAATSRGALRPCFSYFCWRRTCSTRP
jgi:HNH endonuclease